MKRISMLLALSVAALTGTALMAQMQREITVHLQHPLMVNETNLPAGDYSIQIQSAGGGDTPVLIIQSRQNAVMALASRFTPAQSEAGRTHLVLQVKDGVYHLDKVVVGNTGFELQ